MTKKGEKSVGSHDPGKGTTRKTRGGGLIFSKHASGAVVMGWTGDGFVLCNDVAEAVNYLRRAAEQLELLP
jgi:hypothetical protein